MRVAIAGAGNVGRSIARELIANDHHVLLIDKDPDAIKPESVPGADWLLADACEVDSLEEARVDRFDQPGEVVHRAVLRIDALEVTGEVVVIKVGGVERR